MKKTLLSIVGAVSLLLLFSAVSAKTEAVMMKKTPGISFFKEDVSLKNAQYFEQWYRKYPAIQKIRPLQFSAKERKQLLKPQLTLNLFPETTLRLVRSKLDKKKVGREIWRGQVANDPTSKVTLVAKGTVVAGNLYTKDGVYEIRPAAKNLQSVRLISLKDFPEDVHRTPKKTGSLFGNLREHVSDSANAISEAAENAAETVTNQIVTVDVIVAYTRAARDAAGSDTGMSAIIDLAVDEANQAYSASGVKIVLNLVKTVEVNYTESNNLKTDLDNLEKNDDDVMDNLHALRDRLKADIVTLFMKDGEMDYCGIGNQMNEENAEDFADYAFSVVDMDCISNRSYMHELGHNMGIQHDKDHSDSAPLYPYGYGYQDPDGGFRDIMSYKCAADETCPRLLMFSSPAITYQDKPLGVAEEANNAKALNASRFRVAEFRKKK